MAVALDSRSAAAQQLLGTIYAGRGEVDEAIAAFSEVLKLSPRSLGAKLQLATLNLRKGLPDPAVQLAEEVLRDAPKHEGARTILVRALVAKRDVHRASTELNTLIAESQRRVAPRPDGGPASDGEGSVSARREASALALHPSSFEAFSGLIAVDIDENNVARARAKVEDRLQKSPKDPATLALAAATFAILREPRRQEELLRRLIEVAPNNLQAFAGLASLYAQENRLDEARAGFEALALRAPRSVGVQTMIAVILQAQRNDAEAEKAYEKVLKMDPGAGLAANNLAWIYADAGRNLDAALELAQMAKRKCRTFRRSTTRSAGSTTKEPCRSGDSSLRIERPDQSKDRPTATTSVSPTQSRQAGEGHGAWTKRCDETRLSRGGGGTQGARAIEKQRPARGR